MADSAIYCHACEQHHGDRWMCDAIKAFIDAIAARAGSYNLDPIDFDQPVPAEVAQVADVMVRQFSVAAGVAEVAGTMRPLLIFSGRDQGNNVLPRWLYIGTVHDILRARDLFNRMVSLAIDQARKKPPPRPPVQDVPLPGDG